MPENYDFVEKFDTLNKLVNGLSDRIIDYLILILIIGTFSMVFLEAIKRVFNLRRIYNQLEIKYWIFGKRYPFPFLYFYRKNHKVEIWYEFFKLVGRNKSFFDQSPPRMLSQIQAATEVALDFPWIYKEFYSFLTKNNPNPDDGYLWSGFAKEFSQEPEVDQFEKKDHSTEKTDQSQGEIYRQASQARTRIGHFVSRELDLLQNKITNRWAKINQVISVLIGFGSLSILLYLENIRNPEAIIFVSLASGMFAPIAKDIFSFLSNLAQQR